MPAQPSWFHRLDAILDVLRQLPAPYLDRQAIEALFQVGARRSRQLMREVPSLRIGNALAVDRLALLQKLEGVAASDQCQRETARNARVGAHLAQIRQELTARRVRVEAATDVHSRRLDGLPPGIELRPGELRIHCQSADDLAAQLYELAQAMANDWPAFQEAVAAPLPRPVKMPRSLGTDRY